MQDNKLADDEEQFIVQNQKQIIQILNALAKEQQMVKVLFNRDTYITNVIYVDEQQLAVYLDIGIDDAFNNRLLASHDVVFSKEDGVLIKWVSEHLTLATLKDGKAIKIALPQKLLRLQRREFFRLSTPIINPVICLVPIFNKKNPPSQKTLELSLLDISLGGIGVILANPLPEDFVIGANLVNCTIHFPDIGETMLTLQVRNKKLITMKDGSIKQRVGLQFIAPSRENEALIKRYTNYLECHEIALATGLF